MNKFDFGDIVTYTLPDFPGLKDTGIVIGRTKYDRPVLASKLGQGMPIWDGHCIFAGKNFDQAKSFRDAYLKKFPGFLAD